MNREFSQQFKYYDLIIALFVAVLLVSNLASTKIVDIGPFTFDGGTVLFPLSYIFGDILTEIYGFKGARRAIWAGFSALAICGIVLYIIGLLPADPAWNNQEAYKSILMSTPRIIAASIAAYFCGEYINSVILSKIKVIMNGRKLWIRTISSTIVGELFDSVIFVVLAFSFTMPVSLLISIIISNYIFKTSYEILATPLTYMAVGFLKRAEGIDTYDRKIHYNPFHINWQE